MQILKNFFDSGLIDSLFIHIRNVFYCSLFFAVGSYTKQHPPAIIEGTFLRPIRGYLLIVIGIFLTVLSLADSVNHINKLNFAKTIKICALIFHFFVSFWVVVIVS